MASNDCKHNFDPSRLVREGSSQAQRNLAALDPAYAPVDQRTPAHRMLFARAYSAYLRYAGPDNNDAGNWQPFFASDVSVQLALAAVQDVDYYKASLKACFDFLGDRDNRDDLAGLRQRLGQLFGSAATMAAQIEELKQGLPPDLPLTSLLRELVRTRLASAFKMLLLYHRDGIAPGAPAPPAPWLDEVAPPFEILGAAYTFQQSRGLAFSSDWIADDSATGWAQYLARLDNTALYPDTGVYGSGGTLFERVNHIATHNLFTSVFERFLKAYARVVGAAGEALQDSFVARDTHEPHYGLFLAFLRLFERVRAEANTLTGRHLDFYYREVLRLRENGAQPGHVHLLAELAKQVPAHLLAAGTLFKAGKDAAGKDAFFALERDTVLNQARVAALQTLYRHDAEPVAGGAGHDAGRLFASPVANSFDGIGAALETPDKSWHPFHNKRYSDGALAEIRMPLATVGFAVASHYLLLAEGARTIVLDLALEGAAPAGDLAADALCLFSTAEGWLEKAPQHWTMDGGLLRLTVQLAGDDPAITPYAAAIHGARFDTGLPVLQVLLRQRPGADYPYGGLQDLVVRKCELTVTVTGLRSLSVSNDFGPVDTSKPFLPYGAHPAAGSALVIGSRELFQKQLDTASVQVAWQATPSQFAGEPAVSVNVDCLASGQWTPAAVTQSGAGATTVTLDTAINPAVRDEPDFAAPEAYSNSARHGFVRLRLDRGFGEGAYQAALIANVRKPGNTDPLPAPPVIPVMSALTMDYSASQTIVLDSADSTAFARRKARFYHVAPFGQAERHALLGTARKVWLLPQFAFHSFDAGTESGAEFYIGVAGLQPPQNLNLLFEVVPGTADPLVLKPQPHILWSYLRANEWVAFDASSVADGTAGLLASGVVTLDMPRDASADNTLLAPGMHWIRLAVASRVDCACRLLLVAAQALEAQFADDGNEPSFSATALPAGTVTKLAAPDPAVKQLNQPFASFGGRGAEAPADFYTRISERLRHKDRAIALWDVERLVLQAFPQIWQARCLNHTQYEPGSDGAGIYRELAPGHVTVVTVPNQQFQNERDPLRPFTSLDLLQQIDSFLRQRFGCFVRLHVRNPQFEAVRTTFKLRLRDGYDESYHVKLLQQELTHFLSPWASAGGARPTFGGKVYKSVLINFVEERPYVDYVSDFRLYHDVGGVLGTVDLAEVTGSLAVAILVSVPPASHAIEVLHPHAGSDAREHCPCESS